MGEGDETEEMDETEMDESNVGETGLDIGEIGTFSGE
jgi:hypothetical protein